MTAVKHKTRTHYVFSTKCGHYIKHIVIVCVYTPSRSNLYDAVPYERGLRGVSARLRLWIILQLQLQQP